MGILVVWCVITYLSPAGGRLFEFGSFILYKINDISSTTLPGFFLEMDQSTWRLIVTLLSYQ